MSEKKTRQWSDTREALGRISASALAAAGHAGRVFAKGGVVTTTDVRILDSVAGCAQLTIDGQHTTDPDEIQDLADKLATIADELREREAKPEPKYTGGTSFNYTGPSGPETAAKWIADEADRIKRRGWQGDR